MSAEEIREEANWVVERLQRNESVLIHCVAGMNRSTTVCCAVLMQLEGLTAEQALERVYEYHPWAKPDSHHWLMLRWLEKNRKE
jgi:protein-tyrosine phosphatase